MNDDAPILSTLLRPALFFRGGVVRAPKRKPVQITAAPIILGRDPDCAVVLDDPEVSAAHCELRAEKKGVLVRDLGSKNGTFINAIRIREALLSHTCTIVLGKSHVDFEPLDREHVEIDEDDHLGALVGAAPKMRQLYRSLREIAPTDLSILVTGESGTGKELVAQAIHDLSRRSGKPFVVVDCGSIPGPLAESLLFGHERGAFTGANEKRTGAFQEAHHGTLFLDELGELPLELQPKLLRVLAERKVKRVGAVTYEPVDVRVVAATRRNLGQEMNVGRFRSDLFFRLAQVRLELPALRDRRGDIPLLVEAVCTRMGKKARSGEVVAFLTDTLSQHDWPGNVRELTNVVGVAASLPIDAESLIALLPLEGGRAAAPPVSAFSEAKREAVATFERNYFAGLFAAAEGNVSEMARRSGMERHHIRAFLRKYGLGAK